MARFMNPPENTFRNIEGARVEATARFAVLSREFAERAANQWAKNWSREGAPPFHFDPAEVAAELRKKVAETLWDIQGRLDWDEPPEDSVSFFIIAEQDNNGNVEVASVSTATSYEPSNRKKRFVSVFYWVRVHVREPDGAVDVFMVN